MDEIINELEKMKKEAHQQVLDYHEPYYVGYFKNTFQHGGISLEEGRKISQNIQNVSASVQTVSRWCVEYKCGARIAKPVRYGFT